MFYLNDTLCIEYIKTGVIIVQSAKDPQRKKIKMKVFLILAVCSFGTAYPFISGMWGEISGNPKVKEIRTYSSAQFTYPEVN